MAKCLPNDPVMHVLYLRHKNLWPESTSLTVVSVAKHLARKRKNKRSSANVNAKK